MQPFIGSLHNFFAQIDTFLTTGVFKPSPDRTSGFGGLNLPKPIDGGFFRIKMQNFDCLTTFKHFIYRLDFSIDFGSDTMNPQCSMNRKGKIKNSGPFGKRNQITLGCENEDFSMEKIDFKEFKELSRIGRSFCHSIRFFNQIKALSSLDISFRHFYKASERQFHPQPPGSFPRYESAFQLYARFLQILLYVKIDNRCSLVY